MTEFEIERNKIIQKANEIITKSEEAKKQQDLNKSMYLLGRMFLSTIFNESRDMYDIMMEIEKDKELEKRESKNKEKGLLPWFDESLKPISEEFGCPYCGEYVYKYFDSHCEGEGCEYEGKASVYCPKKKCDYSLKCQSTTLPLGCWVSKPEYDIFNEGDLVEIWYKDNCYKFFAIKEFSIYELHELIRKFFNYDLILKENEYLIPLANKEIEN